MRGYLETPASPPYRVHRGEGAPQTAQLQNSIKQGEKATNECPLEFLIRFTRSSKKLSVFAAHSLSCEDMALARIFVPPCFANLLIPLEASSIWRLLVSGTRSKRGVKNVPSSSCSMTRKKKPLPVLELPFNSE